MFEEQSQFGPEVFFNEGDLVLIDKDRQGITFLFLGLRNSPDYALFQSFVPLLS